MPYRIGGCPRCGGALLLEEPGQWSCLSCGYIKYENHKSLVQVLAMDMPLKISEYKRRSPRSWDKYLTGGQVGRPRGKAAPSKTGKMVGRPRKYG